MLETKIRLLRRCGVGISFVGFVFVIIAIITPGWINVWDSDYRSLTIKVGLFYTCYPIRWISQRTSPVELCRSHFTPFYEGFAVEFVQYFFALCVIGNIGSFVLTILLIKKVGPLKHQTMKLRQIISIALCASGVCGIMTVIVFASTDFRSDIVPHTNPYYFGYSFALAVVGSLLTLIASSSYYIEMHLRKQNNLEV